MPAIELSGVTRQFSRTRRPALLDVSSKIAQGEIVALVGESGSGKTTFLRILAGLEEPDRGEVRIQGKSMAIGGRRHAFVPPEKRKLGLVFQDGALFPHLNATKNVAYGLKRILPKQEWKERVTECLCLVGLDGKESCYPHELSGGERQRLALARALAPAPDLLLLDEPFSHLDPALRRRLRADIRQILEGIGKTAIIVTHDPEDALAVASRVLILNQGQVVQSGSPSEVYYRPANQYCAERFGPANRVIIGTDQTVGWKRPEEARWIPCEVAGEGYNVSVLDVRQMGPLFEVLVQPEAQPDDQWLCFLKEPGNLTAGEKGRVAWRSTPDPVVWRS